MSRWAGREPRWIAGLAFIVGSALRLPGLPYATPDAHAFLIPWYDFAREHGLGALGHAFTNYTPVFSYLLLVATAFDGVAPPLTLVKAISFAFEFGCAVLASRLVGLVDPRPIKAALAFAAVWTAPSVLHNGSVWGQADSIWTFFVLLALLCCARGGMITGVLAFGVAAAIKAQALFLAPFVLGIGLRWRATAPWLAAIPLVYIALAAPTLLAGRPFGSVLTVYLDQATTFRSLSMNAANLYAFVPNALYGPATAAGLAFAAAAGLAFALWLSRAPRLSGEGVLLAGAVSLLLMPFLLPKMHERHFYAFEVVAITLACARPALVPVAVMAQIGSALSYIPFYDAERTLGVPIAALTNGVTLLFLSRRLRADVDGGAPVETASYVSHVKLVWFAFAALLVVTRGLSPWIDSSTLWPANQVDLRGLGIFLIVIGGSLAWRAHRPLAANEPPRRAA